MNKTVAGIIAAAIIIAAVILGAGYFMGGNKWVCEKGEWVKYGNPIGQKPSEPCEEKDQEPEISDKSNLIKVSYPNSNDIITSPLTVKGEARGTWFFEASFPVKILDDKNNLLGTGIAQAQGDWMTENFVPFEAKIDFENPQEGKGVLVLEKDNPSGLPENADELRIPIAFGEQKNLTVKAYFNNSKLDPEYSCNKVFAVARKIPYIKATARAAIEELLKGPSESEKAAGYFTSINEGVKINSLVIENGTAKIDFDSKIEYQVGGSCRVTAIRAEITETLKQFSSVKNVIISVNGRNEDILQL